MRKLSILAVLWFTLSGCAVILVGAGAAGGYAIGKDYIQGETDKDFNRVYDSAVNIADSMGVIESRFSNPSSGKIKASVETSSLDIYVERLTKKTARLKVRSRKNLMPNIELAQKVYNRILQDAK